jgi:hypothetical protein
MKCFFQGRDNFKFILFEWAKHSAGAKQTGARNMKGENEQLRSRKRFTLLICFQQLDPLASTE